ncbi:MAG: dTMP kinase [bacterium]|nr:dTMP kinase [bacterium]
MNIVFEGIDGVGKTTVIDSLKRDLEEKKEVVRYVDELTQDSPISDILNKMLSDDPFFMLDKDFPTSIFESLLLAADLHYRQEKYKYNDGFNLYDRDFLSILSYQKEILKSDYENFMDFYRPFKEIVLFNLKPIDLLVYIHVPLDVSVSRVAKRDNIEFIESQRKFLQALKTSLENELIPQLEKQNIKVLRLDGRDNPHQNVSKIYKEIGYGKN